MLQDLLLAQQSNVCLLTDVFAVVQDVIFSSFIFHLFFYRAIYNYMGL